MYPFVGVVPIVRTAWKSLDSILGIGRNTQYDFRLGGLVAGCNRSMERIPRREVQIVDEPIVVESILFARPARVRVRVNFGM